VVPTIAQTASVDELFAFEEGGEKSGVNCRKDEMGNKPPHR